jgi:hypothetical protein
VPVHRSTNFIKYEPLAARSVAPIQLSRTITSLLISAARPRLDGGGRLHQPEAVTLGHRCGGCHHYVARLAVAPLRASPGCGGLSSLAKNDAGVSGILTLGSTVVANDSKVADSGGSTPPPSASTAVHDLTRDLLTPRMGS